MAITTERTARGTHISLDEDDVPEFGRRVERIVRAVNEETGELDYAEEAPTWEQLSDAFARREQTGIALDAWKAEGKRIKLEDEEAQHALIRLGRRMRRGRG
jgi:hypothetical protein